MTDKVLSAHTLEELIKARNELRIDSEKRLKECSNALDELAIEFLDAFVPSLLDAFAESIGNKECKVTLVVYTTPYGINYNLTSNLEDSPNVSNSCSKYNTGVCINVERLYKYIKINCYDFKLEETNVYNNRTTGKYVFSKTYIDDGKQTEREDNLEKEAKRFISSFLIPSFLEITKKHEGYNDYAHLTFFFAPFGTICAFENVTFFKSVLIGKIPSKILDYSKEVIKRASDICNKKYKKYIFTNEHIAREDYDRNDLENMLSSIRFSIEFPDKK